MSIPTPGSMPKKGARPGARPGAHIRNVRHPQPMRADVVDVEIATFEWVNWWNESRLHQSLGYRTSAEVEAELWGNTTPVEK